MPGVIGLTPSGYASGKLHVVDPQLSPADRQLPPGAAVYSRLDQLSADPGAVVHVCTGPDQHAKIVLAAQHMGYRRFLVEKPMTARLADAKRLVGMCESGEADILVVSNWSASSLTDEIRREINARTSVPLQSLSLRHAKPRMERTIANSTHRSAFDVEIPHLVALAIFLTGKDLTVRAASGQDMMINDKRYPMMGSASISLSSGNGLHVWLESHLAAPKRERLTEVVWADGTRLLGFHPCDSTDRYAQLFIMAPDGRQARHQMLYDDTVRRMLHDVYSYFAGTAEKPANDVHFGAKVIDVIESAKVAAQLNTDARQIAEEGYAGRFRR
jgi:predicted dehydrogenase